VNALVGLIQDKHEELKERQRRLESVLSAAAITAYRNPAQFVERRHLVSLDDMADDRDIEHEEDEEDDPDDGDN
jgi:hypothetical protein